MHYFIVVAAMAFCVLLMVVAGKVPMAIQLWFVIWVIGSLTACAVLKISPRVHL